MIHLLQLGTLLNTCSTRNSRTEYCSFFHCQEQFGVNHHPRESFLNTNGIGEATPISPCCILTKCLSLTQKGFAFPRKLDALVFFVFRFDKSHTQQIWNFNNSFSDSKSCDCNRLCSKFCIYNHMLHTRTIPDPMSGSIKMYVNLHKFQEDNDLSLCLPVHIEI